MPDEPQWVNTQRGGLFISGKFRVLICIWPVSNIYLACIGPVSDLYLTLSDLYLTSIWPVSDQYLTSIWPVSDLYLTSIWPVYDQHMTSIWSVSNLYQTFIWPVLGMSLVLMMSELLNITAILTMLISLLHATFIKKLILGAHNC